VEKPVRIFVSYSHLDRRWLDKSDPHNIIPFLEASLVGRNVVFWYDLSLEPGTKFQAEIENQIDKADIAVLLISQNLLNSDFIRNIELPRIEARAEKKDLLVLPILAEHCDWEDVESLRSRQMLPGAPMPLIEFIGREADWSRVRYDILQALKKQVSRVRDTGLEQSAAVILGEIQVKSVTLAGKLRPVPMTAFVFRSEIEPLVNRLAGDADLEKEAGRSAAVLYRLQAGAILLDPAAPDVKESVRKALPWLRRAIRTFPAFQDAEELGRAEAFLDGLLVPLQREVLMKPLLKSEFRLVMIDAPESEVDTAAEKAVAMIGEIIRQKDGRPPAPTAKEPAQASPYGTAPPGAGEGAGGVARRGGEMPTLSGAGATAEQKAALKLGFVLGSKLTLAALPPQARSVSFSGLPFDLAGCSGYLAALGIGAGDASQVIDRTRAAMADANGLRAGETLLGEINRVKDALNSSGRAGIMAAYRIGFTLGYIMEFASILIKNGAQPAHAATYEALVQKHRGGMSADIPRAGLPTSMQAAAERAAQAVRTPEDLSKVVAACRDVLAMIGES